MIVTDLGVDGGRDADRLALEKHGIVLDWLDTVPAINCVQGGDGKTVNDDGKEDEEIHRWPDSPQQITHLFIGVGEFRIKMPGVFDVKGSSDSNGAKVSHKQGLLPVLDDVRHELVHDKNSRDAAEGKDEEPEGDKAGNCDAGRVWLMELAPWDHGAEVHEASKVEEDING